MADIVPPSSFVDGVALLVEPCFQTLRSLFLPHSPVFLWALRRSTFVGLIRDFRLQVIRQALTARVWAAGDKAHDRRAPVASFLEALP